MHGIRALVVPFLTGSASHAPTVRACTSSALGVTASVVVHAGAAQSSSHNHQCAVKTPTAFGTETLLPATGRGGGVDPAVVHGDDGEAGAGGCDRHGSRCVRVREPAPAPWSVDSRKRPRLHSPDWLAPDPLRTEGVDWWLPGLLGSQSRDTWEATISGKFRQLTICVSAATATA